jgi:hypothetical protein
MTKKMTTTQAKASQKSNKSEIISKWSGLIVRKESLHNNGKQWATGTKGNSILLDNGLTLSLFSNPNMVKNIKESKTTLELATNAGTKTTKQIADKPVFCTVWYDKPAIANIFGLLDLKEKHRITFDSDKEDAFIVHKEEGNMNSSATPRDYPLSRCQIIT